MTAWDIAFYALVWAAIAALAFAPTTLLIASGTRDDKPALINLGVLVAIIVLGVAVIYLSPHHSL